MHAVSLILFMRRHEETGWAVDRTAPLPPKVARLATCVGAGISIPPTVVLDLGPGLTTDVEGLSPIRSGLAQATDALLGATAFANGPVPLALRRVSGGPRVWPALLSVGSDRLTGALLAPDVLSWLKGEGMPVRVLLLQPMHPSENDVERFTGVVWSRASDGAAHVTGFVRDALSVRTFGAWANSHPTAANQIVGWTRDLELATKAPSRIGFGVGGTMPRLLSAHRLTTAGWVNARVLVEQVKAGQLSEREAVLASVPDDLHPPSGALGNRPDLLQLAVGRSEDDLVVTGRAAITIPASLDPADPWILVRQSLTPLDATPIAASVGVVAAAAGSSSHMVVLAHGLGKAVLAGVPSLVVDSTAGVARLGPVELKHGDWLTVDGATDGLYSGRGVIDLVNDSASDEIVRWAKCPEIPVFMNADFGRDVRVDAAPVADGIGLCRSERHLTLQEDLALVDRLLRGDSSAEVVEPLKRRLAAELDELLVGAKGQAVHYRLLDLGDFVTGGGHVESLRGVRWGIVSGFYVEQVRAVRVAVSKATQVGPVDIVVVAPLVSLADEARWLRRLVDSELSALRTETVAVRVGFMIETPLGIARAADIASHGDVVCVGTNDLTEQVWATRRNDSQRLLVEYDARGLSVLDPFQYLGPSDVAPFVRRVVDAVHEAYPDMPVVMCGEHASVTRNAILWTDMGRPIFSARRTAVGPIRVALFQHTHAGGQGAASHPDWPAPTTEAVSREALSSVRSLIATGRCEEALNEAWAWAREISAALELPSPANWKFFKRDCVAHWFGANPSRRFQPGWSLDEVAAYAETLRAATDGVRFSLFPRAIACHAMSEVLPARGSAADWHRRLSLLDRTCSIEVFPQQSPAKMCFRAVLQHSKVRVEAGLGQAMYVFEQERGRHRIASGELWPRLGAEEVAPNAERLDREFRQFKRDCGDTVAATLLAMQASLGVDWLGIEGYYAPAERIVVCDADLPLDLALDAIAAAGRRQSPSGA